MGTIKNVYSVRLKLFGWQDFLYKMVKLNLLSKRLA